MAAARRRRAAGDRARPRARGLVARGDVRAGGGARGHGRRTARRLCRLPRRRGHVAARRVHGRRRRLRRRGRCEAQAATSVTWFFMEGGGMGFPFGGDPEDLLRGLREFAEQQAETVQEAQREQFATLTLNTAVELTAAALQQVSAQGGPDEQAVALRDAMRVLFPEAVALVSAARQGFMREG